MIDFGASNDDTAPRVALCADATTLTEVDAAKCAALSTFTLPDLTHAGLGAAGGKASSDALVGAQLSGYTAFKPGG